MRVHVVVAPRRRAAHLVLVPGHRVGAPRPDASAPATSLGTSGGTGTNHDGEVLHFGLRAGDEYLDPMLLFGAVDLASVVHLAPTAEPFGYTVAEERRGLLEGLRDFGGGVVDARRRRRGAATGIDEHDIDAIAAALAAGGRPRARDRRPLRGAHPARARRVPADGVYSAAFSAGMILYAYLDQRAHCDDHAPPADGTGGSGHRVMLVAGIGSGTDDDGRTIDAARGAARLRAGRDHVLLVRRRRRCRTPRATPTRRSSPPRAGSRSSCARSNAPIPDARSICIAHSQGGVVVLAFLKLVYDPGDPTYPPLGTVITLSSPLEGAPLATLADEVRDIPGVGRAAARRRRRRAARRSRTSTRAAVEDLAEDSPFMAKLDAARLPESVELTTIGSLFDHVVPADRATGDGAQHTVIDAGLLGRTRDVQTDDEALMAMRSALEGRPLPCQSLRDVVTRVARPAGDHARRDRHGWLPAHDRLRGAAMSTPADRVDRHRPRAAGAVVRSAAGARLPCGVVAEAPRDPQWTVNLPSAPGAVAVDAAVRSSRSTAAASARSIARVDADGRSRSTGAGLDWPVIDGDLVVVPTNGDGGGRCVALDAVVGPRALARRHRSGEIAAVAMHGDVARVRERDGTRRRARARHGAPRWSVDLTQLVPAGRSRSRPRCARNRSPAAGVVALVVGIEGAWRGRLVSTSSPASRATARRPRLGAAAVGGRLRRGRDARRR